MRQGGDRVDFVAVMDQVIALLRQRDRLMYCTLQRQFQLDEAALEDLTVELIKGQRLAADEDGEVLVWIGEAASLPAPVAVAPTPAPLGYTPPYLAEKILTSRRALEGERKQVTVLFADVKGSMALLADCDPEEARHLLDPVLERMMDAVHRYEGTVNQVMGDGIMPCSGPWGTPGATSHTSSSNTARAHRPSQVMIYETVTVPHCVRRGLPEGAYGSSPAESVRGLGLLDREPPSVPQVVASAATSTDRKPFILAAVGFVVAMLIVFAAIEFFMHRRPRLIAPQRGGTTTQNSH
jgi:Adenylate and Guanylate cyclase catalytic domain